MFFTLLAGLEFHMVSYLIPKLTREKISSMIQDASFENRLNKWLLKTARQRIIIKNISKSVKLTELPNT
jgi:hypothetical protein